MPTKLHAICRQQQLFPKLWLFGIARMRLTDALQHLQREPTGSGNPQGQVFIRTVKSFRIKPSMIQGRKARSNDLFSNGLKPVPGAPKLTGRKIRWGRFRRDLAECSVWMSDLARTIPDARSKAAIDSLLASTASYQSANSLGRRLALRAQPAGYQGCSKPSSNKAVAPSRPAISAITAALVFKIAPPIGITLGPKLAGRSVLR